MDRARLERLLDEGLSLEEVGRRLERHPSTVGYWLRRHGLAANGAEKHAPLGGIPRETLEALVAEGLSTRAIARELGVSQGTVRHWLRRYGLRTSAAQRPHRGRETRDGAEPLLRMECPKHGHTEFGLRPDGYRRCLKCRSDHVSTHRRRLKAMLIEEAGGACVLCGYDRCVAALHFHHRDRGEKLFGMGERGLTRSIEAVRAEAEKCVLLCSNCHAEVETGLVHLS